MDSLNPLTDAELRGLVRDAVARVRSGEPAASGGGARSQPTGASTPSAAPSAAPPVSDAAVTVLVHASQALFMLGPGGDADGNCIIEPAVRCTHCGFCQTYGH